ncbi:hypothetical protein LTR95_016286 [Oleoguttula sp. CCFEE 5521]
MEHGADDEQSSDETRSGTDYEFSDGEETEDMDDAKVYEGHKDWEVLPDSPMHNGTRTGAEPSEATSDEAVTVC